MTLREGVRRLRADDPETGILVRVVLSALLIWAFVTAGPAGPGVRPVLAAALACWFVFVAADRRLPRLARVALALAAVLPAVAASQPDDASSLLYLYAALFTFVLLPRTPMWAILSLTAVVLAVLLTGLWMAGRGTAAMLTQPALIAVLVLFSLHRREYRLRAEQTALLLEQITQTRAAQARAAALDERARIARELHDVLAHSLGALGVQLEVAEIQLTERGDVDGAAGRIRQARELAADGLAEARSAVRALRADVPPLPQALHDLVTRHEADHGAAVTLRVVSERRPLSPGAEVSLLRIAREALTNAARHAPGAPVTVTLDYADPAVARLTVRNPVPGASARAVGRIPATGGTGGLGLIGARERIALVGGTLKTGPADGQWQVIAEAPVPGAPGERWGADEGTAA
ncbi:histidine kinase [Actinoplanes missouriensis]|uniref:sensor histidine kinase n=1 Tax=Actinoplanes missouriensis TaxID=1866 RepID=UPI0033CEFFDF